MPRYPEILKPTAYEPIVVSPVHVINVPKATPVFLSWRGNKILDDYNGMQVLNVGGEPAFAELAILFAMRAIGWEGVWIDTYGRKYRTGYWAVAPLSELPRGQAQALERIYARAGSRSGAWDVYCWNGPNVLFAESKRAERDRIRASQRKWLAAAIEEGAFLWLFLLVLFAGCGGSDPKQTTTSETSLAGPANRPATITTQEDTPTDPFTPQFQGSRGGGSPPFAIVKQPGRGSARIANNMLIYTPDADFSGQDNLKYKATDPGGFSATGTAVVNVTAVNDPPMAAGAQRPVYAGFAGAWTPWVDDADIWDTFSYQVSTQALNGTASVVGGRLQYTPTVGFTSGTDNFAFDATDSGGAEITGTASVRVYDNNALTRCTSPSRVSPDGSIAYLGRANPCAFYGVTTTRTTLEGTPVTMDFYNLWPSNTNAPKGVVVLIGGGDLNMAITGDPGTGVADNTGGGNFIVRTAQLFADAGYQAVAIDRPSDQTVAINQYRISVNHSVDILQVLKHMNTENRDVFLAGTSRGSISVVANNLIATGISLSSPVTTDPSNYMFVGRPGVPSLQPSFVQRPVHVLWHQDDLCSSYTPPAGSQALYDNLSTTTAAAFNVASGGVRVTLAGYGITPDVCGAFDYHGYLGIEPTAVGFITDWLDDQVLQLAGNKRPEAAFATVATAPGVPKQIQLTTLTRDPDDDPLSYALSHARTSLGGSVTVNDSMVVYTPPPGVSEKTDYFVYVVTDGKGGVAAGVITVQISG